MQPKFNIRILFIFFHAIIFAQTDLPIVVPVFSETKANTKVYESLKNDFKIMNPKACEIEMKTTIGHTTGGTLIHGILQREERKPHCFMSC